jgi:hypothetical protein
MLSLMKDLEHIHRQRQRMLVAVALIGLGLLFVTMLTAGSRPASAEEILEITLKPAIPPLRR